MEGSDRQNGSLEAVVFVSILFRCHTNRMVTYKQVRPFFIWADVQAGWSGHDRSGKGGRGRDDSAEVFGAGEAAE